MPRFAVYAGELLVGYSMLESGDAPMGVAFGEFVPNEEYSKIQRECMVNHADQSALQLSARTEAGMVIPCAGVGILDYTAEIEPPYIEVNVLGISYPLYGELFQNHVVAYERQFKSSGEHNGA